MISYIQVEWIKLLKNAIFWVGLSIFAIFMVAALKFQIIDYRVKELGLLIAETTKMLALPIIFLNGFIPTLVGQEFRYNALKFELLAGRSRIQKFFANILSIANYAFLFGLLFTGFAAIYLYIDLGTLPVFDGMALKNVGIVFAVFFFYSYFLNTLTLLIRSVGLTMFIAFIYFFINSLLMMSPYAGYASMLPVGALYQAVAPTDLTVFKDAGIDVEMANPYMVFAITSVICFFINLLQFWRRDIK